MTDWKTRPNGDLDVSILTGIVTAIGPDGAVALRLEHSETIHDFAVTQLLMTPDHAETIGRELIETARLARETEGQA